MRRFSDSLGKPVHAYKGAEIYLIDCAVCGLACFAFEYEPFCWPCTNKLDRPVSFERWIRRRYMDDLEEYLQAVRTLPQPLWEEIEPEFYFPFKSWKESTLRTAPRNTDGTTPTLLQLWERSLVEERVPIVAPFAEIQTILTPSAGADCSVEGARGSTRPQHIPPQCTVPFY